MTFERSALGQSLFDFMVDTTKTYSAIERHDDICINRHGNNEASNRANRKARHGKQTKIDLIIEFAKSVTDFTSNDLEVLFGPGKNKFSGRLTTLIGNGTIVRTGEFRDDCHVLRLVRREG